MCQSILCFLLINYSVFFHVRKEGGQNVVWCKTASSCRWRQLGGWVGQQRVGRCSLLFQLCRRMLWRVIQLSSHGWNLIRCWWLDQLSFSVFWWQNESKFMTCFGNKASAHDSYARYSHKLGTSLLCLFIDIFGDWASQLQVGLEFD